MRMTFRRLATTGIAALLAAVLGGTTTRAQQAPPAPLPTGAISGVVIDAATGEPVAGAVVSLNRRERDPSLPRVTTDSKGRFVFRNLAAHDDYFLGARRFGFSPTWYGALSPRTETTDTPRAIPIADGQWVSTISIPMWRLAAMSGRVTDERGEPVVGVAVRAFSRVHLAGNPYWVGGPVATTDDLGIYRLADVDPGQYVVGVLSVQSTVLATTPAMAPHLAVGELEAGAFMGTGPARVEAPTVDGDGGHRLAVTVYATPPPPTAGLARAYPPAFYPEAESISAASPIDVATGDEKAGLDIRLRPVHAVRVSGRFDRRPESVPESFVLRLMPVGGESLGAGSEIATTILERDGSFTFLNVPTGQYTLLAAPSLLDFSTASAVPRVPDPPGYVSDRVSIGTFDGIAGLGLHGRAGLPQPWWARAQVTVGAEDITDLVVPLRSSPVIHGHLVLPPGARPLPDNVELSMTAEPANGDPSFGQPFGTLTSDGQFEVRGLLTGSYLFSGWTIASVVTGGQEVRDTGIDVSSGANVDDVVVTLATKTATIDGSVGGIATKTPAAVIIFPAARSGWTNYGWHARLVHSAMTRPDGTFELGGLSEGTYLIVAVDPSQRDAWVDPAFLEAAAGVATPVSVKWGETKSVTLTASKVVSK